MSFSNQMSKQARKRRGTVVVLTAVIMTTLLLFASLAIDVGYICALTAEQQNTADAAALAGASALRESLYDQYEVRALSFIAMNQETQGYQSLADQIVEVGRWDKTTLTFTALTAAEASSANAVRVVAARNQAPLFFAGLMGIYTTDVTREAIAQVTPSCNGIWGITSVKVPGSVYIDSYDSTAGPYDLASAGTNGDVCSNGEITVSGNADIMGDALSSTGDVTINGGAANISGATELAIDTITVPPIDFGDIVTNNDNGTIGLTSNGTDPLDDSTVSNPGFYDLILRNDDSITLNAGTYIFDDIEMHSNSSINITGPVTIYLDDDFEMEGNTVFNTGTDTSWLTIIADGDPDGSKIKLSGQAEFYGSIFAPNSEIHLSGSSDYYGVLIGDSIEFKGSFAFHVDESLPLMGTLKGPVMLVR